MAIGAVFFTLPALTSAQIVPQPVHDTIVGMTGSNTAFYMGTSTGAGTISNIGLWLGDLTFTGAHVSLRVTCLRDMTTNSQSGCNPPYLWTSDTQEVLNVYGQPYYFTFADPITLQSGKVYLMEVTVPGGDPLAQMYGASTTQFALQCSGYFGNCGGAPYISFDALPDWSNLNATTTASLALYQEGASNTLAVMSNRCQTIGNVFGEAICSAFAFVFIPSPTIMDGFAALPTVASARFPFSWFVGMQRTYDGLTASSTANMATVVIPFASHVATSSAFGTFMPDVTVLSSTTITEFMPSGFLNTMLLLEGLAIWVLLGLYIYHDAPRWLHK